MHKYANNMQNMQNENTTHNHIKEEIYYGNFGY
nr:MAG TPA: hypothetical protein [Caudoviricetes sp.]